MQVTQIIKATPPTIIPIKTATLRPPPDPLQVVPSIVHPSAQLPHSLPEAQEAHPSEHCPATVLLDS